MSPAIRDLLPVIGNLTTGQLLILEDAVKLFLCHGVKIGGIYQHWKGDRYEVLSITRDADNWSQYLVNYQCVDDSSHKGSRKLEDFLGDMNDHRYTGPRFRLIG